MCLSGITTQAEGFSCWKERCQENRALPFVIAIVGILGLALAATGFASLGSHLGWWHVGLSQLSIEAASGLIASGLLLGLLSIAGVCKIVKMTQSNSFDQAVQKARDDLKRKEFLVYQLPDKLWKVITKEKECICPERDFWTIHMLLRNRYQWKPIDRYQKGRIEDVISGFSCMRQLDNIKTFKEFCDEKLKGNSGTLLVYFYSENDQKSCSYTPTIEEFAQKNLHYTIAKVNADQNSQICEEYGINSFPAFLHFKIVMRTLSMRQCPTTRWQVDQGRELGPFGLETLYNSKPPKSSY